MLIRLRRFVWQFSCGNLYVDSHSATRKLPVDSPVDSAVGSDDVMPVTSTL